MPARRRRRQRPPAASEAVSAPTPASVETPPVEAVAPAPALAPPPRKHHHVASAPKPPTLTLQQHVLQVLSSNPRTRRVNCYTNGSTVTIFGKVFDADAKLYAEKLVRQVPGVGNVIDSLTTDTAEWAARQAAIASQLYAAGLTGVTVKVIGHDAYLERHGQNRGAKAAGSDDHRERVAGACAREYYHSCARKHVRILICATAAKSSVMINPSGRDTIDTVRAERLYGGKSAAIGRPHQEDSNFHG